MTSAEQAQSPPQPTDPRVARFYRGLWGVVARWLRVPTVPPRLPGIDAEHVRLLKPSRRWLSYLRLKWLVGTVIVGGAGLAFTFGLEFWDAMPHWLHVTLVIVELAAYVLGLLATYLGIHLQYDATWYVLSDRSMCLRRGIWTIHETTLTFENVQNVSVRQGPIQRLFGIHEIMVETAGGGGKSSDEKGGDDAHRGKLEGIQDVEAIRGLLMTRIASSKSAGLGDEPDEPARPSAKLRRWSAQELAVLREIRDALAQAEEPQISQIGTD